jgi:hypothetical protein
VLERRTPLARGGPLARRSWLARRGHLRSISPKRLAARTDPRRAEVRAFVFTRDGGCLLADDIGSGECFGPLTPHHLLKERHGGPYEPWNLVALCAHHNDWVEDWPLVAHTMGLVIRQGDEPAAAWRRLHQRGLVQQVPEGLA